MCVATTTIVAAGIAAGGSIAGAKIASNAAKNAANTQTASADKAIGLQQSQYQQARQDFNPYQQAGAGAVGRLQQRAAAPPPSFTPGQPSTFSLGNPMGQPPQMPQQGPPMPAQGGQPQQGDMVLMRAPDGSTRPVPRHMVQMAMQKGAQVVQ